MTEPIHGKSTVIAKALSGLVEFCERASRELHQSPSFELHRTHVSTVPYIFLHLAQAALMQITCCRIVVILIGFCTLVCSIGKVPFALPLPSRSIRVLLSDWQCFAVLDSSVIYSSCWLHALAWRNFKLSALVRLLQSNRSTGQDSWLGTPSTVCCNSRVYHSSWGLSACYVLFWVCQWRIRWDRHDCWHLLRRPFPTWELKGCESHCHYSAYQCRMHVSPVLPHFHHCVLI